MKLDIMLWLRFMNIFNEVLPVIESRPGAEQQSAFIRLKYQRVVSAVGTVYTPWPKDISQMQIKYLEVPI